MSEKKQQPAYPLRMPAQLRDDLETLAKINKRSLNAEIVARLEFSIEDTDDLGFSDRNLLSDDPEVQQFGRAARGIDREKLTTPPPEREEQRDARITLDSLLQDAILRAAEKLAEQMNGSAQKGPTAHRVRRTRRPAKPAE